MDRQKLLKWFYLLAFYLFWPAAALIVWGELDPKPPSLETNIWDKALHFIAYFGLAGIAGVALKADRRMFAAVLGLVALGGVLEILQGFTGRDPSLLDEAANTLGAVCGAGAGWLLIRLLRPKILASPGHD
jgi:VanZ family protein